MLYEVPRCINGVTVSFEGRIPVLCTLKHLQMELWEAQGCSEDRASMAEVKDKSQDPPCWGSRPKMPFETCEGQIWRAGAENDHHGRLSYVISDSFYVFF